ncbi:MAG: bifunctional (p)ppGpp synthetase/guanosine-3',5'-bis(diphosphate) 3'-pyrophosphohydrolase [Prevotella sp.]|nr:bifunctional (p)ppGpp synthetase/guanosine-3',5'-bis(diphosphate) 3'-pyrophosphohydrolase [Prevotella sp.]
MKEKSIDSSLLDRAILFAVKAHADTERKGKGFPYIVHPLEAMAIVATMTSNQELLAAAVLHDTIEDTDTTMEQLCAEFGPRVAKLVETETDQHFSADKALTWHQRKQESLNRLASASRDAMIVALGDKLSNMRGIAQDYAVLGDELWQRFNVKTKADHAWRFRQLAEVLKPLGETFAYQEFRKLVIQVFGEENGK